MPVKPRCTFKECKTAAQRIVGDCGFCDGHFCAKHRLLEDHKCTGLEDVSLTQSEADVLDNSMSRSCSPASIESSKDESVEHTTQWWLVGLAEYLSERLGWILHSASRVLVSIRASDYDDEHNRPITFRTGTLKAAA
ncbi:hypothetical protein GGR58DRAFT_498970 [Xylaria digitata]|nr:hypothetical protein GGR58DRAFT_498970 [Xylaria digitata]